MEPIQFISVILLLLIAAEATFLVVKASERTMSRGHTRRVLLDTSVLIDGRIIPIASTGFIGGRLVIPRSVIGELQLLADTGDHDKRTRARFGLDVVTDLQAMKGVDVEILQDGSKASEGVDERLLSLAKKYGAAICTIDYNLNKVAAVEEIEVLNINELAQGLRMAFLPGEKMQLELVQKGQDSHQAVGYLADGTMVVVEQASSLIGSAVDVEIIRSLQTAAGKMMFARLLSPAVNGKQQSPGKPSGRHSAPRQKVQKRTARPAANRKPSPSKQSIDPESRLINLVKDS